MQTFVVNQPYIPGRHSFPEGIEYNYRFGTHELRVCLPDLSQEEILAGRKRPIRLALFADHPVICVLVDIPELIDWSECPYTIHAVPAEERTVPEPRTGAWRSSFTTFVIDSSTGILKVLRFSTFSPDFSSRLHAEIRSQLATPYNKATYDTKLAEIRSRFPDVRRMLPHALIQCTSGD